MSQKAALWGRVCKADPDFHLITALAFQSPPPPLLLPVSSISVPMNEGILEGWSSNGWAPKWRMTELLADVGLKQNEFIVAEDWVQIVFLCYTHCLNARVSDLRQEQNISWLQFPYL